MMKWDARQSPVLQSGLQSPFMIGTVCLRLCIGAVTDQDVAVQERHDSRLAPGAVMA